MAKCLNVIASLPAQGYVEFSHFPPSVFFFNDTATTEIYTLSLHDALPISTNVAFGPGEKDLYVTVVKDPNDPQADRKSTRLNSSHQIISYAVFCLNKKKAHVGTLWQNNISLLNLGVEQGATRIQTLVLTDG